MQISKRFDLRRGFSLIELLIVIFLISLIYFLGFQGVEFDKPKPKALTPLNLKSTLLQNPKFQGKGTFMCINECQKCYWRSDIQAPFEPYESPIALLPLEVYTLDEENALRKIEYERYQDQKVCLLINFYANGSSTPLILEDEKGSYFLPAFFEEPMRFESSDDAKEYWVKKSNLVSHEGDFY